MRCKIIALLLLGFCADAEEMRHCNPVCIVQFQQKMYAEAHNHQACSHHHCNVSVLAPRTLTGAPMGYAKCRSDPKVSKYQCRDEWKIAHSCSASVRNYELYDKPHVAADHHQW